MAPAGTPADVILKLDAAEDARLRSPEVGGAVAKLGMQTHVLSPQDFINELGDQVRLWKAVIAEAGVHLD